MKQPTEAQIKEFWEWCGFGQNTTYGEGQFYNYPDGGSARLPELDLNNLFKYAVPKVAMPVMLSTYLGETEAILPAYFPDEEDLMSEPLSIKNNDPALALFWAIKEATQ